MSQSGAHVADDSSEDDVEPLLVAADSNNDARSTSASSSSAFNIQALRERTRMPYSGTPNVIRQRNTAAEPVKPASVVEPTSAASTTATTGTAASKPSLKGKERAVDQDDVKPVIEAVKEETTAASPTDASPFTCHIWYIRSSRCTTTLLLTCCYSVSLEVPASDDCVVTRCGCVQFRLVSVGLRLTCDN